MKRTRSGDEIDQDLPSSHHPTPPSDIPHNNDISPPLSHHLNTRKKCPYLDTVDRQLLDFDMEKVCSVTLSNMNIYACLVCGKFLQGRGQTTPAFTHSVQYGHFVFMNLHNCKAYCLPDGYEIIDSSLDDVKKCLNPIFSREEILALNHSSALARDVHGVTYLPGFIGLNNLSHTDYINVTLHALSHVRPLREFFLDPIRYSTSTSVLVHKFGEVMRKIWSKHNFKSVVSPQEFIQTVTVESKRKFSIGKQSEAIEFMIWLLNQLHLGLGGSRKSNSSIIYQTFQGQVEVTSLTRKKVVMSTSDQNSSAISDHNNSAGITSSDSVDETNQVENSETKKNLSKIVSIVDTVQEDEDSGVRMEERWIQENMMTPFLFLSLDIPPTPLFKDSAGGLIIPQIPLFEVLKKIDGETWTDNVQQGSVGLVRKKYRLKLLPRYLILHLTRFTKNNFYVEKNPTIVTFPVKNLELRDYLLPEDLPTPSTSSASASSQSNQNSITIDEELLNPSNVSNLSIKQLKEVIRRYGNRIEIKSSQTAIEKEQLQEICKVCLIRHEKMSNGSVEERGGVESEEYVHEQTLISTKYDLIANICHDSIISQGVSIVSESKMNAPRSNLNDSNVLQNGIYRIHVQNKATTQWFEIQDLHVMETMPQLIGLSESYLLIYEKKPVGAGGGGSVSSGKIHQQA